MNAKNKDLPAYPIKFTDQFNQTVVLGGMTKQELVQIELLKSQYINKDFAYISKQDSELNMKWAYEEAELFCNYQEKTEQSKIIS